MNCHDAREWLNALLDGELDAKNEAEVRHHLEGCAACMKQYRSLEALRDQVKRAGGHEMPEALRRRILAELPREPARARARWLPWAGWPVAAAASALLAVNLVQQRANFSQEIVAVHVRSLLAAHLNDVVSSDHHTVKPWFAGKLDFSPPVPDLASAGFELEGGRLDYLDHQKVAALVYRRHAHVINLLVRTAGSGNSGLPRASVRAGFALRSWQGNGLEFIAISDTEPAELEAFQHAYVAATQSS
jgi:mycothiol system anti-sigma-R factor